MLDAIIKLGVEGLEKAGSPHFGQKRIDDRASLIQEYLAGETGQGRIYKDEEGKGDYKIKCRLGDKGDEKDNEDPSLIYIEGNELFQDDLDSFTQERLFKKVAEEMHPVFQHLSKPYKEAIGDLFLYNEAEATGRDDLSLYVGGRPGKEVCEGKERERYDEIYDAISGVEEVVEDAKKKDVGQLLKEEIVKLQDKANRDYKSEAKDLEALIDETFGIKDGEEPPEIIRRGEGGRYQEIFFPANLSDEILGKASEIMEKADVFLNEDKYLFRRIYRTEEGKKVTLYGAVKMEEDDEEEEEEATNPLNPKSSEGTTLDEVMSLGFPKKGAEKAEA